MKPRTLLVVIALIVLLLAGVGAWLVLGDGDVAPTSGTSKTATAPKVDEPAEADRDRRAEPSGPSIKWARRGTGTLYGSLHEYGTERPIAGVTVKLEAGRPGPGETLETETDEFGSFRFDDVTNFDAWTIRVKAPPPLADLQMAGVKVTENQDSDVGRLYLTPEFSVPGIVVSELGEPIEGATVKAVRMIPGGDTLDFLKIIRELPSEPVAVDQAPTDVEGKFKLTKVPPGRYQMIVTAAGFQMRLERDVIITPEVSPLRFVMAVGFSLRGRVVREGEGQVQGIGVVAFPEPNGLAGFTTMDKRLAVTDENGEFELDGLKGGRYIVAVTPENEPFALKTEIGIPTSTYVEIQLGGDCWLDGQITDPDSKPVAEAQIFIIDDTRGGAPTVANTSTDGAGRYRINGLKPGPLQAFMVQAKGFSPYPGDPLSIFMGGSDGGPTLVAGPNEHNVQLARGATVQGVVISQEDDSPIAGAKVSLMSAFSFFGGSRSATTDAEGAFTLNSVPMGPGMLNVSKDGWFQPGANPMQLGMLFMGSRGGGGPKSDTGRGATVSVSRENEVIERTLKLAPGATIKGRVLSPEGEPVPGAQVRVSVGVSGMMRQLAAIFPTGEPRITDSEGRFELPGPKPGEKAQVVASAQGYLDGQSTDFKVGPGETLQNLDVTLRVGAVLAGTVAANDGKPIAGAMVRWYKPDPEAPWATEWRLRSATPSLTSETGEFRIEQVDTGKLIVQVSHGDHVSTSKPDVDAKEGTDTTLSFKLDIGGKLEGRVLAPTGRPASGARVRINLTTGDPASDPYYEPPRRITTDPNGKFKVEGLPPGTYSLMAEMDGTAAPSKALTVEPGAPGLVLQLEQAYSISGMVRGTDGAAISNVRVEAILVTLDGEDSKDSETTNQQGQFTVRDLPGGTYRLRVQQGFGFGDDRPNVIEKTVDDVQAGAQNIVIEVEAGLTIAGTVRLATGEAPEGGWVTANRLDENGNGTGDRTGAALTGDTFKLTGLKVARYRVTVNTGTVQSEVVVEAGNQDVRIDMSTGGTIRGRVTLADGSPGKQINVRVQGPSGGGNARTDDDGRYEVRGLAAGSYTVSAANAVAGKISTASRELVELDDGASVEGVDLALSEQ